MTTDDSAVNNYTQLRAAGLSPEKASYLACQWAYEALQVTGHKFKDSKLYVEIARDGNEPYFLLVDL